jgi:hypothetical protein
VGRKYINGTDLTPQYRPCKLPFEEPEVETLLRFDPGILL